MDLNSDMGEDAEAIASGAQEALMPFLTSANIACGGHAGDAQTMKTTVEQALRHGLAIGAHPSYPDREHFGRLELDLAPEAIRDAVFEQIRALDRIARACGGRLSHVKAHGALYNQAARSPKIAEAIAQGVARCSRDVVLVGLAGSAMLDMFRNAGFTAAAEAFADRRYEPDGSLRSRKFADGLIKEPADAARQALEIADEHSAVAINGARIAVAAQTLCIHSDTPGAANIAQAVAEALRVAGFELRALSPD